MKPTLPKITVVTPSYNQATFLEQTLRSVLDQEYPHLEYIVLDGGSNDGSADIIRGYAASLAHWRSQPDEGQAAALREGFAMATGDILTWLNSDDLLAPGALHTVAAAWNRFGEELIVAGGCQPFDDGGAGDVHYPTFQQAFSAVEPLPVRRILDLAWHWFPGEFFFQPEVFFPRRAYEAVGGVDPSFHYTMDYDLWVRFALAGVPVVVLPEPLARFREHGEQKTADRAALHRQMVETANRYLASGEVDLPAATKRLLIASNAAALLPPIRGGWKLLKRLRGQLGRVRRKLDVARARL